VVGDDLCSAASGSAVVGCRGQVTSLLQVTLGWAGLFLRLVSHISVEPLELLRRDRNQVSRRNDKVVVLIALSVNIGRLQCSLDNLDGFQPS
jgi:hypothetical protein